MASLLDQPNSSVSRRLRPPRLSAPVCVCVWAAAAAGMQPWLPGSRHACPLPPSMTETRMPTRYPAQIRRTCPYPVLPSGHEPNPQLEPHRAELNLNPHPNLDWVPLGPTRHKWAQRWGLIVLSLSLSILQLALHKNTILMVKVNTTSPNHYSLFLISSIPILNPNCH